jgi:hypothetical protein
LEEHLNRDCSTFLTDWNFLRETMFHEINAKNFLTLKNSPYWEVWSKALKEDNFGKPPKYCHYPESSGNLIHHAFSLSQIYPTGDIKHLNSILEFGGGYGSFCRLLYRLGFQGKYIGYDFPVFVKLQKMYLEKVGILSNKISLISELKEKVEVDLFIALWSLNETPRAFRDNFLEKVSFKEILLSFSKEWHGDNIEYFKNLVSKMPEYDWVTYEVPNIPNSYYLIGRKK